MRQDSSSPFSAASPVSAPAGTASSCALMAVSLAKRTLCAAGESSGQRAAASRLPRWPAPIGSASVSQAS